MKGEREKGGDEREGRSGDKKGGAGTEGRR